MRPLPIRIRLTLLYFVFFAAAGLLLSATSWMALRHSLKSTAQHELEERADDVQAFLNAESPNLSLAQVRNELVREYSGKDEGKYLQVFDDQGEVLYFSDRRSLTSALDPFPNAAQTTPSFRSRPGGLQILARAMPVHGKSYRVATAITMKKSNALLQSFLMSLLLLTPGLLLLAALAGHLISRRALAPVAAITAAAKEINDLNLSTRLPVTDTQDELGDLSSTLNQMLERIDAAFSSVRAFTANASHEMRTPVALIRTRVEIALCFPRTVEQYRNALVEVQASTEHMTAMLDSLLRLARADAGAEHLQCEPVELNGLLHEVSNEWQDTAQRLHLDFSLQSCDTPVWVAGEKTALRRLLHILIDNALRHTPAGGRVTLGLTSSNETATIAVTDTGVGISPHDLPHIFERFYRAEPSRNAGQIPLRKAGAGLGLALAQGIANQHAAKLTVESAPERGSTFSFVIAKTHLPTLNRQNDSAAMLVGAPHSD